APAPAAPSDLRAAPAPIAVAAPESDTPPPPAPRLETPPPAPPTTSEAAAPPTPPRPPRIDGVYLGLTVAGTVGTVRVNNIDTPGAFGGWMLHGRVGQMVLPWLGLGLQGGGGISYRSAPGARQTLRQGGVMADFNFVPAPDRLALSLRASFGFGAGAVREEGRTNRRGFGGSLFAAAIRYEFFPGVQHYRATRGGGFGIGPELGWIGATPAAAGRPMANTFYLGVSSSFYFGS